MGEAYIVAIARTAGGRKGGRLKDWHPVDMAAAVLNNLVDTSGIDPGFGNAGLAIHTAALCRDVDTIRMMEIVNYATWDNPFTMFEIMDVASRADLKSDPLKELERHRSLLQGYRGHPPGDVDAIQELLLRLSRLVEEVPDIVDLDLNPIFALPPGQGYRIVDARIRVAGKSGG